MASIQLQHMDASHERDFIDEDTHIKKGKEVLEFKGKEEPEESQYRIDQDDDDDDDDDDEEEENTSNGRSTRGKRKGRSSGMWGLRQVSNPKTQWVQEWDRIYLLVCTLGLIVDPLFLFCVSMNDTSMCIFMDGWLALTVTILRGMIDVVHLLNMSFQFQIDRKRKGLMYGNQGSSSSAASVAWNYFKCKQGFFFDLFLILPIPQILLWVVVPSLLERGSVTTFQTVFILVFLVQYLPKAYQCVSVLRRTKIRNGYIFGRICSGIVLNMTTFFVAGVLFGGVWYILGLQRATKCLRQQCRGSDFCDLRLLACKERIYYGSSSPIRDRARMAWANNDDARRICLDNEGDFSYGDLEWALRVISNENRLEKLLLPIFWGLMTLSTFGNLESTTEWSESLFHIICLTVGILLVTLYIGNVKVLLFAMTTKRQAMQLKMRNIDWWMENRNLPEEFRRRVRNHERQQWAAMRGVNEADLIRTLPEGLRRDVKYYLCLDLVKQVPLFQHMDEMVLENICDRVKSLILPKGEFITKEGDPVQRMLFIVRGHIRSSQTHHDGVKSRCMLGPGNFSGDELLAWCLRRPFVERLPLSSSTLATLESTEAFVLEAEDLKYVTQHFRYTFMNEKVRRSARYYSLGWRTWAAVAIQVAWRRYKRRVTQAS